jgi:hypothetical protein
MTLLRDLMAMRYEGKLISTTDSRPLVKRGLITLDGMPGLSSKGIECLQELQSEPVSVLERPLTPAWATAGPDKPPK